MWCTLIANLVAFATKLKEGISALAFGAAVAVLLMSTSSSGSDSLPTLECPNRPSCVSSRARDSARYIEALQYRGELEPALERLARVIDAMPRSAIRSRTDRSVHASFRSRLFGFVDDVDFVAGDGGTIDVRSVSRSGYYDFGVNRRRVETIRTFFAR